MTDRYTVRTIITVKAALKTLSPNSGPRKSTVVNLARPKTVDSLLELRTRDIATLPEYKTTNYHTSLRTHVYYVEYSFCTT